MFLIQGSILRRSSSSPKSHVEFTPVSVFEQHLSSPSHTSSSILSQSSNERAPMLDGMYQKRFLCFGAFALKKKYSETNSISHENHNLKGIPSTCMNFCIDLSSIKPSAYLVALISVVSVLIFNTLVVVFCRRFSLLHGYSLRTYSKYEVYISFQKYKRIYSYIEVTWFK